MGPDSTQLRTVCTHTHSHSRLWELAQVGFCTKPCTLSHMCDTFWVQHMMSSGGPEWYSTQGSMLSHLLSLIGVLSGTGTILQWTLLGCVCYHTEEKLFECNTYCQLMSNSSLPLWGACTHTHSHSYLWELAQVGFCTEPWMFSHMCDTFWVQHMMSSGGPEWYSTQGSMLSHLLSLIGVLSGTCSILQCTIGLCVLSHWRKTIWVQRILSVDA